MFKNSKRSLVSSYSVMISGSMPPMSSSWCLRWRILDRCASWFGMKVCGLVAVMAWKRFESSSCISRLMDSMRVSTRARSILC